MNDVSGNLAQQAAPPQTTNGLGFRCASSQISRGVDSRAVGAVAARVALMRGALRACCSGEWWSGFARGSLCPLLIGRILNEFRDRAAQRGTEHVDCVEVNPARSVVAHLVDR
jgi:hypothetical protein